MKTIYRKVEDKKNVLKLALLYLVAQNTYKHQSLVFRVLTTKNNAKKLQLVTFLD